MQLDPKLEYALAQIQREYTLDNLARVGTILRDEWGIPSVRKCYGLRLASILQYRPELYQIKMLERKRRGLEVHLKSHKKDRDARRSIPRVAAALANLTVQLNKRR